jgi:hypothetical protein
MFILLSIRSNNWAGYISTGGTFTSVRGSWTVPDTNAAAQLSRYYMDNGIKGKDLIQTGNAVHSQ